MRTRGAANLYIVLTRNAHGARPAVRESKRRGERALPRAIGRRRPQPGSESEFTIAPTASPRPAEARSTPATRARDILAALDVDPVDPTRIPFSAADVTAGMENELQVAVLGGDTEVDLPITIRESNYYANIVRRAARGDTAPRSIAHLDDYLRDNRERVWENSWVRFPRRCLGGAAEEILYSDLRAHKGRADSSLRADLHRFLFAHRGEPWVRLPISYLVKLALVDSVLGASELPAVVHRTASRILPCFLSDNTSPEIVSFHVSPLEGNGGPGSHLAREAALRLLLVQLLAEHANEAFGLRASGQEVAIFSAPGAPLRQKQLNRLISDSFYRELFMSPCLSGWEQGELKRDYMVLCHQVLSRSQLNAVAKMREAGIVTHNLVVLPCTSNTSLANNGTHITIGSRKLSAARTASESGFDAAEEKCVGDLVIKIYEHFLPLFVGTYSAAPYRLDFADFHPEVLLGFLPHQLDYTHLRMIWRRWRKKARNRFLGRSFLPLGPQRVDRLLRTCLRLRGDFVPDHRLLDYPVALLSTHRSPGLDGSLGNTDRLRRDLDNLGVFDARMSIYLPYRLREFRQMGFCGFEARTHSLPVSLRGDLAPAAALQALITSVAYRLVAAGRVDHDDIPDTPAVESERRQALFAAAIGLPTFFVSANTPNRFLREILRDAGCTRPSGRYGGHVRVVHRDYQLALLRFLRRSAGPLLDAPGFDQVLADLEERVEAPERAAASGRLARLIADELGVRDPFHVKAEEYNRAAERVYRTTLRWRQTREGLAVLREELAELEAQSRRGADALGIALERILGGASFEELLRDAERMLAPSRTPSHPAPSRTQLLRRVIALVLIAEANADRRARLEEALP